MTTHQDRRLADLDPSWITDSAGRVVGVAFRCPIHDKVPGNPDFDCLHRVGFTNPPDGGPAHAHWRITWQRTGDTFDDLRLSPSIRNLGYEDGGGCRWHGFVGGASGERPGVVVTLGDSK